MSEGKMTLEDVERESSKPVDPGRVRVEIAGADGETKVSAAEALAEVARASLSRIQIAFPGRPPVDAIEAFTLGYSYHETGFELTVSPKMRVFRNAMAGEGADIVSTAKSAGAPLPFFHRLVLGAAKFMNPKAYERGSSALIDALAREFAKDALGAVMATMQVQFKAQLPEVWAGGSKPRAPGL